MSRWWTSYAAEANPTTSNNPANIAENEKDQSNETNWLMYNVGIYVI